MKRKMVVSLMGVVSLVGCATLESYQKKIEGLCAQAMVVAPYVPSVAVYIYGGCATEAGIAKLVSDTSSAEWLTNLINNYRK